MLGEFRFTLHGIIEALQEETGDETLLQGVAFPFAHSARVLKSGGIAWFPH